MERRVSGSRKFGTDVSLTEVLQKEAGISDLSDCGGGEGAVHDLRLWCLFISAPDGTFYSVKLEFTSMSRDRRPGPFVDGGERVDVKYGLDS